LCVFVRCVGEGWWGEGGWGGGGRERESVERDRGPKGRRDIYTIDI